ncbi:head-tail adaptor protein [Agrobacterium pusense]|uniref:head-tail adaptor protein n=1 Tax=Agrobacterium pusense TaxID=648995 RepID=UPI002868227E|nr:head-tail adaptor protein [Agrobacterium pusense]WMW56464.1 head-tail adaptor protein [Agrobacterium pusense]
MTTAQELDRSIAVERSTETENELNEPVVTWSVFVKVRAKRRDASDGEKVSAGQLGATLMTRFVVRSSTMTRKVLPTDRIRHDERLWHILGIKQADEGRNRFIEISAITSVD